MDIVGVVVGAAFSIPVAIYAPLVTDMVKQRRGERNKVQAAKRRAQLEHERDQVTSWLSEPHTFTRYLLGRVLVITLMTAFTTLASGIFAAFVGGYGAYIDAARPDSALLPSVLSLISIAPTFIGVIGTVVVIQVCVRTLRSLKSVNRSEQYFAEVADQLFALKTSEVNGNDEDPLDTTRQATE